MKQVLQSLETGRTEVADVPPPAVGQGQVLVRTSRTLISAGTERMLVEFGRAGALQKARTQPDQVRKVLEKARTDGVAATFDAVRRRLGQPLAMGYSNAGVVIGVGAGVRGFAVGDRVASNGKHAEIVCVPANLCAKVPDHVSDDEAVFTVLGAIALQGIRLVAPSLGEAVVVTGLGLIGLLTVQLLRAHGCRVLGIDLDPARIDLARQFGADVVDLSTGADPVKTADAFSRGRGVDAVVLTPSTQSSEPVHQAALMCRQRGRIVLVGVVGLELSRDDFYKKELTFQVSSSYGPGRYDPNYEEGGQDYPVGFVRWTEQRNFEAVLDMMADGRLNVKPLISHRFPIDEAVRAYDLVASAASSLGIELLYRADRADEVGRSIRLKPAATSTAPVGPGGPPGVSFVGAGNYATAVLIPAFQQAGAHLRIVASKNGVTGLHAGRKFGFDETTTDLQRILNDPATAVVVINTRHDTHARLVLQALQAGKDVFVEKPLCLTGAELAEIQLQHGRMTAAGSAPRIMVGFNRRFAPQIVRMKALLADVAGPKALVMTVNAGAIPADHWTQDPRVGGGRIVGEGCHFIDVIRFLTGARISDVRVTPMTGATDDTATIQIRLADGSIGTVHYFANGSKRFPKERLEVFVAGRVLQLDNFRRLQGFGVPGFTSMNLWRQDKGQQACAQAFLAAVTSGAPSPIPFDELVEVSAAAIGAALR
jgi:predicted dehydrogenase/threonine dehydrogenase-like Zn-dependent dehydrogenase